MTDTTQQSFRNLLGHLAITRGRWRATPLTGFACLRGNLYSNGLMVVGRAVNGWASGWTAEELLSEERIGSIVEELYPEAHMTADCPMRWVSDSWGSTIGYNTKKSAFWRVIRNVACELGPGDPDDYAWPSYLSWTNLYKVSPCAGRNPSDSLADVQLGFCKEILKSEINALNPNRILFLTGWGWAQWFLSDLGFVADSSKSSAIEKSGTIFNGARIAVIPHPERKQELPLVEAAVDYFRRY